jgi:hypothetical protein
MSHQFAVVQSRLESIDFETLRRAFAGVSGLAPFDAEAVCAEADGILCRGLTAEQALTLQAHLKEEGVEVERVDESLLPVLPMPRMIRRVQITPEALLVEDLVKGFSPFAWDRVRLLAAGSVRLTTFQRTRSEHDATAAGQLGRYPGLAFPVRVYRTKVVYVTRESTDWHLRAEILVEGGPGRCSIEAEHFFFSPPGEGAPRDLSGSFCRLVRELAAHAPNALHNRGVAAIASDPCEFVYYPRKGSFLDEITWMLWKARQGG